jgi:hypothetical protein
MDSPSGNCEEHKVKSTMLWKYIVFDINTIFKIYLWHHQFLPYIWITVAEPGFSNWVCEFGKKVHHKSVRHLGSQ